ncbi:phage tail tube protein [Haloarcula sp. Atlit-120R]|uniref:phage tail tube protein n=1 Tax=Haloarcula sp. Atlit-120R TaxID=2282135 RepID=UPI000EF2471C|nr:phage tail tube protein [Haloarcula sp. Atlit-120R]RLM39266.1 hypothetical protein DVK01_01520 [Haloarcula sp. Atlit-120R]
MPGAGSGNLAFGKETSFMESLADEDNDGNPDYWHFGRNPSLTELSLDNQLQRMRDAGVVENVESVKQAFEGAVGVEATISSDTFDDVEDIVFNDAGTSFTSGQAASSRIYAGVDYVGGTAERELIGCIPTEFTPINYTEGGLLTFSISFLYADENKSASITPSNVNSVSNATSAPDHALTLDIDGVTVTQLQSAQLSISSIARFIRGAAGPAPVDAVIAAPESTVETSAVFGSDSPSRLELAYGSADATSPEDLVGGVSATLDVTVNGTQVSTYNLTVTPASGSWENVISTENTEQSLTWNVDGGVSVA